MSRAGQIGGMARISVENVNHPGKSRLVDAASYQAMRRTLLRVLPGRSPGLTHDEMSRALLPRLPVDVFPGGAKTGWWLKTVQLDLEAKELIVREKAAAVAPVVIGPGVFVMLSTSPTAPAARTRR